jgi:hypothetical protein
MILSRIRSSVVLLFVLVSACGEWMEIEVPFDRVDAVGVGDIVDEQGLEPFIGEVVSIKGVLQVNLDRVVIDMGEVILEIEANPSSILDVCRMRQVHAVGLLIRAPRGLLLAPVRSLNGYEQDMYGRCRMPSEGLAPDR